MTVEFNTALAGLEQSDEAVTALVRKGGETEPISAHNVDLVFEDARAAVEKTRSEIKKALVGSESPAVDGCRGNASRLGAADSPTLVALPR